MTSPIRIRPRFWLALPEPRTRWAWVPLSLIFRKQRRPERPTAGQPSSPVSLFRAFSFVSQIRHFHAYENKQILAHSIQHQHFSRERTAAERLVFMKDAHRREASVVRVLVRERSIETNFDRAMLHEQRQTLVIARHLSEITKQMAEVRIPRPWPTENRIASPVERLLWTPHLFRLPVSDRPPHKPESPREMLRRIRGKTVEAVVEGRLTPRLRQAEPQPAAPAVPSTPRSVAQVWRQPQHLPQESSSEARRLRTASENTMAESPVHSRIDLLPAAAAPPSVVGPTRLEGPAIERLAEDVMKRIERHLRIERERRGI